MDLAARTFRTRLYELILDIFGSWTRGRYIELNSRSVLTWLHDSKGGGEGCVEVLIDGKEIDCSDALQRCSQRSQWFSP